MGKASAKVSTISTPLTDKFVMAVVKARLDLQVAFGKITNRLRCERTSVNVKLKQMNFDSTFWRQIALSASLRISRGIWIPRVALDYNVEATTRTMDQLFWISFRDSNIGNSPILSRIQSASSDGSNVLIGQFAGFAEKPLF